jgi:hypothetical protein
MERKGDEMSEMPRLIWTSDPNPIEIGEITIEMKFRRNFATIIFREAAKRKLRPVDLLADIVENALLIIDAPVDSSFDVKVEDMMDKLWG